MSKKSLLVALLSAFLLAADARALTIHYTAIDLADQTPGADRWRYDYAVGGLVNGQPLGENEALAIYFDVARYRNLENPIAPNADWLAFVLQPDPSVPPAGTAGEFDALAIGKNPQVAGLFSVEFVWLAAGTPGSQPFDVLRFDSAGQFVDLLDTGVTQPTTVPEPATALLTATGLALFARRRRR